MHGFGGANGKIRWWWWGGWWWLDGKVASAEELIAVHAILGLERSIGDWVEVSAADSDATPVEAVDITGKGASMFVKIDLADPTTRTSIRKIGALLNASHRWTMDISR